MVKPTVRIPKVLLNAVDKAATERGVSPSVLTSQAIRFYLAATDPELVAKAVVDALKPLTADIRHIRYRLDQQAEAAPARSEQGVSNPTTEQSAEGRRSDLIKELIEQKRQATLTRFHSTTSTNGGNRT